MAENFILISRARLFAVVLAASLGSATFTIAQSTQGAAAPPPQQGPALTQLSGAPVVAQVPDAASAAHRTYRGHERLNIDDRVKVLAKNLDLNEAQQSAVKKILEQRQLETLQLRLDPSISGDAQIDRFLAIQDNTVKRIRAVLNDEQKKKYDPLAVRRIPPAPDHRSVEDWLEATAPK